MWCFLSLWSHYILRRINWIFKKRSRLNLYRNIIRSCYFRGNDNNFYMYCFSLWTLLFISWLPIMLITLLFTNDLMYRSMRSWFLSVWTKMCIVMSKLGLPSKSFIWMYWLCFPLLNLFLLKLVLIMCLRLLSRRLWMFTIMLFHLIVY